MFRNNHVRKRQSFPPLRSRTLSSPLRVEIPPTPTDITPTNIQFGTTSSQEQAIEALTVLLQSQREELAEKDAALENYKTNNSISISTVAVNKLTSVPNFRSVQTFSQQFDTATHLKVLENIGVEARQAIEYEANLRGLSTGSSWIHLETTAMLSLIKSCYPQQAEGKELSAVEHIEKMKSQASKFFPEEPGSAKFVLECINFCDLLSQDITENTVLQKEWVSALWEKIPSNMKIKLKLKEAVKKYTTVKEFIYAVGKYNFNKNQLTLPVIDEGYIVTLDPRYSFHYNVGKRKELDQISTRDLKQARLSNSIRDAKSDATVPNVPCLVCGRSNPVKVKGKEYPHSAENCYCKSHVDKNTSPSTWLESANGKAFLALGKNILPINFKLSGDRKSLVEYENPKDKPSGAYYDDINEINF